MHYRGLTGSLLLTAAAALCLATGGARAWDETKYPDFGGQWKRPPGIGNQFDVSKPQRLGQQVPLTPEYEAIYEAGLQDQNEGGQGNDPTYQCIPDGMPRVMNVIFPMEIVVTPKTTYVLIEYLTQQRRIFTDGRNFPEDFPASFQGYSVGSWIDTDGDGKYDVLEVETRFLKNPRTFDPSGAIMHEDGNTVVKERIYLDKANANLLHDDITTVDSALTHPYTVNKKYVREEKPPVWVEAICPEGNPYVQLEGQVYMRSSEGKLMPGKKGQKAPDLTYFTNPPKE